jgi:hypothetical protein
MAVMVDKKCACCKIAIKVRAADVARGWGKYCSKSCKAKVQEKKNGQHRAYIEGRGVSNLHPERLKQYDSRSDYEKYLDELHPFSSEALGQWQ